MSWEYRVKYLAWENTETGELSETDPTEKITLVHDREEWDEAEENLPYVSKVWGMRRLYGRDNKKVRTAMTVVYDWGDELNDKFVGLEKL